MSYDDIQEEVASAIGSTSVSMHITVDSMNDKIAVSRSRSTAEAS